MKRWRLLPVWAVGCVPVGFVRTEEGLQMEGGELEKGQLW
jgi:hypothetical protein